MDQPFRILVTGEHRKLPKAVERYAKGRPISWKEISVLEYEAIEQDSGWLSALDRSEYEWIIFSSPRGVRYFKDALEKAGASLPFQTQVACIGEETSRVATENGFTVDFYPVTTGSEGFLAEFASLLSNIQKPPILIVGADGGRRLIGERLRELGCLVDERVFYRSKPKSGIGHSISQELSNTDLILFTSPSSVDAVLSSVTLPDKVLIGAIGTFTGGRLKELGLEEYRVC